MAAFSTLDALGSLSTSVPDWNRRLEELNSTIALRQIELARLTGDVLPAPSLKNKGSTESLRPHDSEEPSQHHDNPLDSPPQSTPNGTSPNPLAFARSDAVTTPPVSGSRSTPIDLSRRLSQNTPRLGLRKRKTESMASAESQAPKYRTRSMIIVYYDSTVQSAFEDLVKFISANRNSMRKGKMNAKMDAMKRAAEREAEAEDVDDDDALHGMLLTGRSPTSTPILTGSGSTTPLPPTTAPPIVADEDDSSSEHDLPPLRFVSTRNMGPPRTYGSAAGGRLSTNLLMSRSSRLGGVASAFDANDIFDDLDKGLEWCQGQCERAAHQFLRDGDCNEEIEGIKKRLLEVKERSEKEIERLKKEEVKTPKPVMPKRETKSRELRTPVMRKSVVSGEKRVDPERERRIAEVDNRKLEVDKMEVDEDEGVEDMDLPPMLSFRRTRDMR